LTPIQPHSSTPIIRQGRLGHNDYEDRWSPTKVEALAHAHVSAFSAGDAHSLAVLTGLRPDPNPTVVVTSNGANPKMKKTKKKIKKSLHERAAEAFPAFPVSVFPAFPVRETH
jgi:hypothetical protein